MDAFYASVELLENPDLAGKAFGVSFRYFVLYSHSLVLNLILICRLEKAFCAQLRTKRGSMAYAPGWLVHIFCELFLLLTDFFNVGFVAMKLCPELILLPLNFDKYSKKSSEIISIFKQYDPNMLVAGCDEGYMKWVIIFSV